MSTVAPSRHLEGVSNLLRNLSHYEGGDLQVHSPIDGSLLASLKLENKQDASRKLELSVKAFEEWRTIPAPRRGELVRIFGQKVEGHAG